MSPKNLRTLLIKNYCTAQLPEYFSFHGLDNKKFEKTHIDFKFRSEPLEYFVPKSSTYGFRKYAFINPYSYLNAVNFITEPSNFNQIKNHLNKSQKILSYTKYPLEDKSKRISTWVKFAENDLPAKALSYPYLLSLDISRFYESIYTHSIAWAIHGRREAKKAMFDESLFGNQLDKVVRNMNHGQTNGLLVGNAVSDLVSELILHQVDYLLEKELGKIDYVGLRFKDDYKFLAKTKQDTENIKKALDRILQIEFNLSINEDKTFISDDPLKSYMKPWKDAYREIPILSDLDNLKLNEQIGIDLLLKITRSVYLVQKSHSQSVTTLLEKLSNIKFQFDNKTSEEKILTIINYLINISFFKEDTTPYIFILIDNIFKSIEDKTTTINVFKRFLLGLKGLILSEFQLIWFHRLLIANDFQAGDDILLNKSKIIELVIDNKNHLFIKPPNKEIQDSYEYEEVLNSFSLIDAKRLKQTKDTKEPVEKEKESLKVKY